MIQRILLLFLMVACAGLGWQVMAQDNDADEKSRFTAFVEEQLSAPGREIRLNDIEGALSSDAQIGSITIADSEGVWLTITNAQIEWTRRALLSGRLDIQRLAADRIDVARRPIPEPSGPAPEAVSFSVPELPVAVILDELEVPLVTFGEGVFGLASEVSLAGAFTLADGSLDTRVQVTRLDGPGGQFNIAANWDGGDQTLALDIALSEPANGIVANALGIVGRPPVALTVSGNGPLDDLVVDVALDADGRPAFSGEIRLTESADGLAFSANLGGDIARLMAPVYRDFFGNRSTLTARGLARQGGGVTVETFQLDGGAAGLSGRLVTAADGFPTEARLNVVVDARQPVILPVPGGETTVRRMTANLNFGDGNAGRWSGDVRVEDLRASIWRADRMDLTLDGTAFRLDQPNARALTYRLDGAISGLASDNPQVADALGDRITIGANGRWLAGAPLSIETAEIAGNGISMVLSGAVQERVFDGAIVFNAQSLVPFAGLAKRDLAGAISIDANGRIAPLSGAFDLTVNGETNGLRVGIDAADGLLSASTAITGRIARGEDGLRAEGFRINNSELTFTADGIFASDSANFRVDTRVADLVALSDRASGAASATGTATGRDGRIALDAQITVPSGTLSGRQLREARLAFTGLSAEETLSGTVTGDAFLDGTRVALVTDIARANGATRLSNLDLDTEGAQLTGDLTRAPDGLLTGSLRLKAPNIETVGALLMRDARGRVDAAIAFSGADSMQAMEIDAVARGVRFDDIAIGSADIQARLDDVFGVPRANGQITAEIVRAGGFDISRLDVTAKRDGETTVFDATATLQNGTDATVAGALEPLNPGFRMEVMRARLAGGGTSASLQAPTSLTVRGERLTLEDTQLAVGDGSLRAGGSAGETLDLSIAMDRLPLAIANLIRPDLNLSGTVTGTADISGARDDPRVVFDVTGRGLTLAALRSAGITPLDLTARGRTANERMTLDGRLTNGDGLDLGLDGSVPIGDGPLDLDLRLRAFPVEILNTVARGQALRGTLNGTARVAGTVSDPDVIFDLSGQGLSAAALADQGIAPLSATVSGRYADGIVRLDTASAQNGDGLQITARGVVPAPDSGLNVSASGSAPLSLANRLLSNRGARASGDLTFDIRATGALSDPQITGTASTAGAGFVDPQSNIQLTDIAVAAALSRDQIVIQSATGNLATGGTVTAQGVIGIGSGFPADLAIRLDQARYADGSLLVATASGQLSVTGPLTRGPLVGGEILVDRAEITIPETLPNSSTLIDVDHVAAPADVRRTLDKALGDQRASHSGARGGGAWLDLTISAPARIFVRGRGVDAELGGSVRLTGPVTDISPVGGFSLIRGRLTILAQRITFDEGIVTLVGDLDPFIDFSASTVSGDVTVITTVSGRASDLQIAFSSSPELPEDEVLARLIFGRSLDELTPVQIARLAAAAVELAGGQETSLIGNLRDATGLDDLDVVSDSEGNAAVRAGRYISDNVYLGAEAGANGTGRVTIDLDITDDLKARGAVDSEGNSSLGIFFERDY